MLPSVNADATAIKTLVFDPVMTALGRDVLEALGMSIITANEQGKRAASLEATGCTLFCMPHCPMRLYSNVLWANWTTHLSRVIILGNSFRSYRERTFTGRLVEDNCVTRCAPLCVEQSLDIHLTNKYSDSRFLPHLEAAFNDLARQ